MEKLSKNPKTFLDYDIKNDLLYVYRKGKFKGNVEIGNIILDLTPQGDVIGIEVLDASNTLKMFNITKDMLRKAERAKLIFKKQRNIMYVGFMLKVPMLAEMPQAMVAIPQIAK